MEDGVFLLALLVLFLKSVHVIVVSVWGGGELPSSSSRAGSCRSLHSVLSELEPLWLCWSAEAVLAEVDTGLAFSLKSVIITVRSPTVTSRFRALLLSMFFNLGLKKKKEKNQLSVLEMANSSIHWGVNTSSSYCFFFSVLLLFHSCQIFLSYLSCEEAARTADSLAVRPAEKRGVVFWKRQKGKIKCVTQYDHKGETDGFTMAQLEY